MQRRVYISCNEKMDLNFHSRVVNELVEAGFHVDSLYNTFGGVIEDEYRKIIQADFFLIIPHRLDLHLTDNSTYRNIGKISSDQLHQFIARNSKKRVIDVYVLGQQSDSDMIFMKQVVDYSISMADEERNFLQLRLNAPMDPLRAFALTWGNITHVKSDPNAVEHKVYPEPVKNLDKSKLLLLKRK